MLITKMQKKYKNMLPSLILAGMTFQPNRSHQGLVRSDHIRGRITSVGLPESMLPLTPRDPPGLEARRIGPRFGDLAPINVTR